MDNSGILKNLFDYSDTGIMVCGVGTWEILYISENLERYFRNVKIQSFVGKNCLELFDSMTDDRSFRIFEKIRSGEEYEVKEYFERRKICLRVRGRLIDYEGSRAMAHYFYDISEEYRLQTSMRNRYYSEITMMSGISPYALGTYRLNLTENSMKIPLGKVPEGLRYMQPMTVDSLFRFLADLCGKKEESRKFSEMFNRRKLLHEYERGITRFSLDHTSFMESNRVIWIKTAITMAKNVDTGDIEAILYTLDIFREKIVEELLGTVSENDYDGIYLIDAESSLAYDLKKIRRKQEHNISEDGERYGDLIEELLKRIPKTSDSYLELYEMLTLEHLRRELKHRPSYTVYYDVADEDGRLRHKKSSYYLMNVPGMMICNTLQDVSGVVQNAVERQTELKYALAEVRKCTDEKNDILSRLSEEIGPHLRSVTRLAENIRNGQDDSGRLAELDEIIEKCSSLSGSIEDLLAHYSGSPADKHPE